VHLRVFDWLAHINETAVTGKQGLEFVGLDGVGIRIHNGVIFFL
jgi:hypothetical protein